LHSQDSHLQSKDPHLHSQDSHLHEASEGHKVSYTKNISYLPITGKLD